MEKTPWNLDQTSGACADQGQILSHEEILWIRGIFVYVMTLNRQFDCIHQSSTVFLADQIQAHINSGRDITPLHVGDPDFATPQAVVDAAIQALQDGLTHYGPSRGDPDLRYAIANKLNQVISAGDDSYNPETEILVTHGAIHAYYLAIQSILNPGDDVLIPDPSWATHTNMVKLLGGNAIPVPARPENGFIPALEDWTQALTSKTRAIVINYPANPTGMFPSRDYLQGLMAFSAKHGLWVVSDEVYQGLYFRDKPVSVSSFPESKDRTILVNSLSKTYAMTGWRVGYLAASEVLIDNALKAGQNSITCLAPFIQKAAVFALTNPGVQERAEEMRLAYYRRRENVIKLASKFGPSPITVIPPQGAFYFFLDVRKLGKPSAEICKLILDQAGVGVVPGSAFGDGGEGFLRMTIAASDEEVEKGFRGILNWAKKQSGG